MIRFNSSDTPGSRPSITGQHPCTGRLRNGQANTVRPYPGSGKTPFRAPGIQIYDLKIESTAPGHASFAYPQRIRYLWSAFPQWVRPSNPITL